MTSLTAWNGSMQITACGACPSERALFRNAAPMSMLIACSAADLVSSSSSKNTSRVAVSLPSAPHTIFLAVWSVTRVRYRWCLRQLHLIDADVHQPRLNARGPGRRRRRVRRIRRTLFQSTRDSRSIVVLSVLVARNAMRSSKSRLNPERWPGERDGLDPDPVGRARGPAQTGPHQGLPATHVGMPPTREHRPGVVTGRGGRNVHSGHCNRRRRNATSTTSCSSWREHKPR